MSKALRTAGMIVGAVALVATGVGAVAGAAVSAKIAATIGVSSLAKLAATASVVSAGLGAAGALTAKAPSNQRQGLQLSFKVDPGSPIPYVIGRTAVGGTIVHRETYGTDNHYQTFFIALSLGPIAGIDARLIDRAPVAFFGTSAAGYYNRWMWQDVQLGATPEARALGHGIASPPFGSIPSQVPGWSGQHRLSGYAAASMSLLFDTKARRYQNGEPLPAWVLRGNLVWDPRLDSTYPGGVGPCRRDDPATWVYSETPALHGLKWRLGVFHNGKKVMGIGAPADLIDIASIVEAANVQEANGWKVGGELNSEMDRWEALKLIEEAGGAEPIPRGGRMATLQKMPRVPVGLITAADIVEARSIPAMKPRRERINGYRARFRSEAHGWEMIPIDIVQVADYVAADGGARTGSGDFSLVQIADQAGSLAAYKVFDSREIGPIELVLKPRFMGYRIGDCLAIEADETGLSGKLLIVRGRSINPSTGEVTMLFETETSEKHAAALGQTGAVPPVPTLTFDPDVPSAPAAADWQVEGGVWRDGEYREPAIFLVGAVGNSNAENVIFEVRLASGGEWFLPAIEPVTISNKVIRGVLAETAYEVAISYKVRGVIGDRRILGPVVTGKAPNAVYDDGRPIEDLKPAQPGADVTGENKAADSDKLGGMAAAEILPKLDRIVPIEADLTLVKSDVSALELADAGHERALAGLETAAADLGASDRQMRRDAATIEQVLLRLTSEAGRTRDVLRDAGIVVDPETGTVRIWAVDQIAERTSRAELLIDGANALIRQKASVDYVNEQITLAVLDPAQVAELEGIIARLTSAEQTIDGLNAAINLKATIVELTGVAGRVSTAEQAIDALAGQIVTKVEQSSFDALATTVGSVEQTLQSLGNVSGISVTIRQARAVADDSAEAALRAIVAGDEAARRQIVEASEIRQELFTRIDAGLSTEATARLALAAQMGGFDARLVDESRVRAAGDAVSAEAIAALGVTSGQQSAAIGQLQSALIDANGGVAGIRTTIRQVARGQDSGDEGLLRAVIEGDRANRARVEQLAQYQSDFTTTLIASEAAGAAARQALLVRMLGAEAAIVEESRVRAERDSAAIERIAAGEAVINDPATGLAATRARLLDSEQATASALAAQAGRISATEASIAGVDGKADAVGERLTVAEAAIVEEVRVRAEQDSASIARIEAGEAVVNDPATGLAATRARLIDSEQATASTLAAQAGRISATEAAIVGVDGKADAINARVATAEQAIVDGDSANAQLITQVSARLDGAGGGGVTLEQALEAAVNRLGQIEGRYTVAIDADGNLSGFELIGGSEGPGSFNLINTDLRMGTGRIIYNNGAYMRVQGTGFGANSDLISWYGPTMAIALCSRANAISYESIDGGARYVTLDVGVRSNRGGSSGLGVGEIAYAGPFGSDGRPVRIVSSWRYGHEFVRDYPATTAGAAAFETDRQAYAASDLGGNDYFGAVTAQRPSSTIQIERSFDNQAWTVLGQQSFTTEQRTMRGFAPTPGDAVGRAAFTFSIGGGFTVNDPALSAATRWLRLILTRGFSFGAANESQRLNILTTEE